MKSFVIVQVHSNLAIEGGVNITVDGETFFLQSLPQTESLVDKLRHTGESEFLTGLIGEQMDWKLLRKQKVLLADIAMATGDRKITPNHKDMAEGLLNLLDFIMDQAVDTFGKASKEVFNKNYPKT
jgi:hypothetical protein